MKKLGLLLMPLMAISFLANCNKTKQYTVTFDSNGGTPVPSQTVEENKCAVKPADPTREEDEHGIYSFDEWRLDGSHFEFDEPIVKDTTLKAEWNTARKYSVSVGTHKHLAFTTLDGSELSTVKAILGQDFKFKMALDNTSNDITYKLPSQLSIFVGGNKMPLIAKDVTITETIPSKEAEVTIAGNRITGDVEINGSAVQVNYYAISIFNYCVNINSDDFDPENPYAESNKDKAITFVQDGSYALPTIQDIYLEIDGNDWVCAEDSDSCSYDASNHKLTILANKVTSGLSIIVYSPTCNLLELFNWDEISDISKAGYASTLFEVGEEKTIKVNEIDQKVRIIGFDHDDLMNGECKAGITFEFVNLLSDKNGYSLATLWDTKRGADSNSNNFLNSDLRYALEKKPEYRKSGLHWYTKDSAEQSLIVDSVIDMLPNDLVNNLQVAKKYVATTRMHWTDYIIEHYDAKVFVLTYTEMTNTIDIRSRAEGHIYDYYRSHDDNASRIKHQVKWHEGANTTETDIVDLGYSAKSYAGYNNATDSYGGLYWLPSPYGDTTARSINDNGNF
ncbi:MAG: InlB B-repeat-containing protein, partial [Bacilli bacterium]|nr:InlB B-repeat-containing protein [Bacilli bacterium]